MANSVYAMNLRVVYLHVVNLICTTIRTDRTSNTFHLTSNMTRNVSTSTTVPVKGTTSKEERLNGKPTVTPKRSVPLILRSCHSHSSGLLIHSIRAYH